MLYFKKLIDDDGISPDIVQDIIEVHQKDIERMFKLYQRYKAEPDDQKFLLVKQLNTRILKPVGMSGG